MRWLLDYAEDLNVFRSMIREIVGVVVSVVVGTLF